MSGRPIHAGGGRFLDDLLVAALERAVALEEMDDVAMGVAEHLHFDVAGREDVLLDQHAIVAERGGGLALARLQHLAKLLRSIDAPHALAAAARDRLDQHRIADRVGF